MSHILLCFIGSSIYPNVVCYGRIRATIPIMRPFVMRWPRMALLCCMIRCLLGGAIGLGMHRAVHAMKVATSHARLFKLLYHPRIKAQSGFLILHRSARRRLGHHLRVYPPIIIRKALEFFDEQIVNTTAKWCDIPSPGSNPHIMQSIQLSFKNDGMDMRPCTRESPVASSPLLPSPLMTLLRAMTITLPILLVLTLSSDLKDTYDVLSGGGHPQ